MSEHDNVKKMQTLICACSDELRDFWLSHQSEIDINAIMSLSISQQRMVRKVWRMTMEHPEGIMLKELAEKLSLSSSAVSVMVDGMVRRGMLIRQPSPEDRRRVLIRFSEKGRRFSEKYEEFFTEICSEFAATQNPENIRIFMECLNEFSSFLYKKNKEIAK